MSSDTCTFSYIAKRDWAPKTAVGVESTWLALKLEFNRQGEGLPGARYYKTISKQGPQLFAVKLDETVWYHDDNKWHKYLTATDIKYDILHSPNLNPQRTDSYPRAGDGDDDPCFGVEATD